jgi:glycerate 2-kinase
MKIVVAPDSFKGTLTAVEAADAIASGVLATMPNAEIIRLPLADGGEGTVEALVHAGNGRTLTARVHGPLGTRVDAAYGIIGGGEIAVIEMSAASGLTLVPPGQRNPAKTTTYGVGELIHAALDQKVRSIIVGVGGSATNDGGAGAIQALGARFLGVDGNELPPGGAALENLATIDLTKFIFQKNKVDVTVACDVQNPLVGPNGSSHVYGPQKGATPEMVIMLDRALARYAKVVKQTVGIDIADMPGGGAAGGLAAGLHAFLGARICSGVNLVLDALRFDEIARDADIIVTGEGRIDSQTLQGKTVSGVLERAKALSVPVVAFAGIVGEGIGDLHRAGLIQVYSLSEAVGEREAMSNAAYQLEQLARRSVSSFPLAERRRRQ